MTMLLFTYDDGEKVATATWSPEYGWMMAGDREILERITVDEREPRDVASLVGTTPTGLPVIGVPFGDEGVPLITPVPGDDAEPDAGRCFNCNHPVHDDPCEIGVRGPQGITECGCKFRG